MTNPQTIEEGLQDALDDINIENVAYLDNPSDPDAFVIIITGTLKKGAFRNTGGWKRRVTKPTKSFDNAKPF